MGAHKGGGFSKIFYRYKKVYAFEANPDLFKELQKRKLFKLFSGVNIYNKAVSDKNGTIRFHISNNEGISSSIGTLKKDWSNQQIKMIKEIKVPCINLMEFIKEKNITQIDSYISDIQGFDLMVLKTLEPLISKGKIKTICSEVAKDAYKNIYENAPDNSFSAFKNYLEKYNYECVAISPMTELKDGVFEEIPEEWWEFDAKFVYKGK